MIACLSFLGLEHKKSFFKMQNADKVILRVGLFLNIGCISSIDYILSVGCISSISLRMVVF